MSDTDPILAKADALMRRHRVFVARSGEPEPLAPADAAPSPLVDGKGGAAADEEIPLLTDIVDQVAGEGLCTTHNMTSAGITPDVLQRWVDEELPAAVLAVLDGVTDKVVEVLTARIKRELIDPARYDKHGN